MLTADYDAEARALYIRFSDGQIEKSAQASQDSSCIVDLDKDGQAVGLEVIYLPVLRDEVAKAAEKFSFLVRLDAIWAAIEKIEV